MTSPRASRPQISPLRAGEIAATARVAKLPSPVAVSAPVCRIATFHSSSLENLVASLPALVALRESFPGARISSWVRAPILPILANFGAVDEAHARPGGGLSAQAALMARLHAAHFDIALCFSHGSNAVMLCWATGAPLRAGFVPSRFEAFLTHRVEKPGPLTRGAALELAREVGARARGTGAREHLHLPAQADERALKILRNGGIETPWMLCAPATLKGARRAEGAHRSAQWNRVLQEMAQTWPLVVTPRPRAHLAAAHSAHSPEHLVAHPLVQTRGKLDVLTLAALIARARGVIGDDAGVTALADLLETRVVSAQELETAPERARHFYGL